MIAKHKDIRHRLILAFLAACGFILHDYPRIDGKSIRLIEPLGSSRRLTFARRIR